MTNEQAIMVLKCVEAHGLADEAKQMAIEALKADKCYLGSPCPYQNEDVKLIPKVGKWLEKRYGYNYCSVCGGLAGFYENEGENFLSNYCPNCGARMEGAEEC